MKRANRPTDFVMLKARTRSDADRCEFALLHVTEAWKVIMRKRLEALEPFKENTSVYCHTYWDSPMGYFRSRVALNSDTDADHMSDQDCISLVDSVVLDGKTWAYIDLLSTDFALFEMTESRLDTHLMMISPDGIASYMCFGTGSDEQYVTEGFDLKAIVHMKSI
ncbi:hypothetical protein [Pedobacter sp. JY14-1]|uniref:hypothetical protein n=1 Tax=Pedobacter sp. JY14-1 TaxID=3034151 RepID=UPI0023E2721D|nr:hypothetical protein [Pedobacter sp. JY14-1]